MEKDQKIEKLIEFYNYLQEKMFTKSSAKSKQKLLKENELQIFLDSNQEDFNYIMNKILVFSCENLEQKQ